MIDVLLEVLPEVLAVVVFAVWRVRTGLGTDDPSDDGGGGGGLPNRPRTPRRPSGQAAGRGSHRPEPRSRSAVPSRRA